VCLACARVRCNGASVQTVRLYAGRSASSPVHSGEQGTSLLECLTSAFWTSLGVIVCGRLLLSSLCTTILSLCRDVMGNPRAPPPAETRPLFPASDSIATPARYFTHSHARLGGWELQLPPATASNQTACAACTPAFVRRLCLLRSILGNRGHVTTSDSSTQQLEMPWYLSQIRGAVPALVDDH
jgi:hypothetical protein